MIKEILLASHNAHKVKEIKELLPAPYKLLSLADINWDTDIPEPFETYDENAKEKAFFIFKRTGIPCFADDSGLEIDELEGRPGVRSARYSGDGKSTHDNIKKVLFELSNATNRSAAFYTVIAYVKSDHEMNFFRGIVYGQITFSPVGDSGFGYDPIFIPDGFDKTFGELDETLKNRISHRAKAMEKFISFLEKS